MSAPATTNAVREAPETIVGRTTTNHISHGGERAPTTSEAVVGTSPKVEMEKVPRETPQRTPQANWFEGFVRSIQGRGSDKGREGDAPDQPPPPSYPPSDEEGAEEPQGAADDAAAASSSAGGPEAPMGHEGEDWPDSSYDPYVEEPLGAEAERVLGLLQSRLKSQHTLRLEEELRGSQESVQALRLEVEALKEDAKNRERLAQAELVNHLRQQVERSRWSQEGFGAGTAAVPPGASGGNYQP